MQTPSIVVMGGDIAGLVEIARLAEARGFDSAWTTEFYDRSATISLAAMAGATRRIAIGSGIAYAFGRAPLVLATEARDIDEVSGGRLVLGLGTGTRRMQADWLGVTPDHPAPRVEELVPLLRRIWRLHEEPVHHDGRFFRMHLVPTGRLPAPRRPQIPVFVAGVGARMVEAAGAVADGLVGHPLFTRRYVTEIVRPALARGAARADRSPPPIAGYVICAIHDDAAVARREAAAQIAFYTTVKSYDAIHELHGFGAASAAIREAFAIRDLDAMTSAVTATMLDEMAVYGTPADVRERFAEKFEGVYERPLLYSPSIGSSRARLVENLTAICETFGS